MPENYAWDRCEDCAGAAVQPPMAPTVATVRFHVVGLPVLVASRMT